MPGNNNRKEYIELPLTPEETPLHLFEKFTTPTPPADHLELALDFISHIDSAIRSANCPQ